jgi:hypothetical protein
LINERNYQFCISTNGNVAEHLSYSVRGWYRLLWESNIPVDFVELAESSEADLSCYSVLILPFSLLISETLASKLMRYVETGGTLVSEAAPGRHDEYTFANRGELSPTLAALFGVRHIGFQMVREPENGARWSPPERTWGEYLPPVVLSGAGVMQSCALRANVYVELLQPNGDAEPVLMMGDSVAGTLRHFGSGYAWLLGTFVGHGASAYCDAQSRAFVLRLLAKSGIQPVLPGDLLLRRRIGQDRQAWIFMNPTHHEVCQRINLSGAAAEDLLDEPLALAEGGVELRVNPLDVRVLIVQHTESQMPGLKQIAFE